MCPVWNWGVREAPLRRKKRPLFDENAFKKVYVVFSVPRKEKERLGWHVLQENVLIISRFL